MSAVSGGPATLRRFLECPVPAYQAELADWLVSEFCREAGRCCGEGQYTTAAWLACRHSAISDNRRRIVALEDKSSNLDFGYSDELIRYLSGLGLSPAPVGAGAAQSDGALAQLQAAYRLLGQVPDAYRTVLRLAASVHALRQPDHERDTSHSSPELPFSIFVSVPPASAAASHLRLAESLLHESLHLLLSLVERRVDLVHPDCRQLRRYSPWQSAERPLGGLLHGIYVFRGIYDFLQSLDVYAMDGADRHHIYAREQQICRELSSLRGFHQTRGLTELGAGFLDALLDLPSA